MMHSDRHEFWCIFSLTQTDNFKDNFKSCEQQADQKLRKILDSSYSDVESDSNKTSKWGTLPGTKTRRNSVYEKDSALHKSNGALTDAEDEILNCLAKNATNTPSKDPRAKRKNSAKFAERRPCK